MGTTEKILALQEGTETTLVNAACSGDVQAFGELVKRYDRQVFRVVRHMTENRQDAEDVVQEAFVKAFCAIATFQGRAAFSTWLIRIAVNEALGRIRHRQKFPSTPLELTAFEEDQAFELQIASPSATPEQLCSEQELRRALVRAIHRLRPRLRAVFVLRDVQGMSAQETAEVLRITVGTVKARLFRARLRVRQSLTPYVSRSPNRTRPALREYTSAVRAGAAGQRLALGQA